MEQDVKLSPTEYLLICYALVWGVLIMLGEYMDTWLIPENLVWLAGLIMCSIGLVLVMRDLITNISGTLASKR